MVSLLVDILICAILLGCVYLLFGNHGRPDSSSTAKRKKKKSKAKLKTAEDPAIVFQSPDNGKKKKPGQLQSATEPIRAKTGKRTEGTLAGAVEDEKALHFVSEDEFPSLSAATKLSASKSSKPITERRAKLLPETGVEDMIDPTLEAPRKIRRTMRIVKPERESPSIIDDTAEEMGEDDNALSNMREVQDRSLDGRSIEVDHRWESVPLTSQKKTQNPRPTYSATNSPAASSPFRTVPGLTEPSKKQRQNAARAAALKADKDAAEQERLGRLAAHKRSLERERSRVQTKDREKAKERQQSSRTNRQLLSGGQAAKVSESGALIWD